MKSNSKWFGFFEKIKDFLKIIQIIVTVVPKMVMKIWKKIQNRNKPKKDSLKNEKTVIKERKN